MSRAVRFDHYGPVEVLRVVDVPRPDPAAGEAVVEVVSAGINPGEIAIREGKLHQRWPATFPSGQGSDFAGRVVATGDGVTGLSVGDEVIGYTDRRQAQADHVAVPADHLTAKPPEVDWDQAGGLYIAGATAYAAVRAVAPAAGETVAVSGAAGGVGSLSVQLARHAGARVIGIASPASAQWLRAMGVDPVPYDDGIVDRLHEVAPDGIAAFIDTVGEDYVEQALRLGVAPQRIDTIINFAAAQRYGAKTDGSAAGTSAAVLAELADLIARRQLTVPIAATYPLEEVRAAYTELAKGHTHGKIVLRLR